LVLISKKGRFLTFYEFIKYKIQCGPAPATHFPKLPLANLLSNTSKLRAFFAIPEVFLFFYAGVDE
jgi:hypothetical protein